MAHSRFVIVGIAVVAVLCATSAAVFAQQSGGARDSALMRPSIEVFAGGVMADPKLDAVLAVNTGASQRPVVTINARRAPGYQIGVRVFPSRFFGFHVQVARFSGDVVSSSTPVVVGSHSLPVPTSSNSWSWTDASFGPLVRVPVGKRFRCSGTLGLAFAKMGGSVGSFGQAVYAGNYTYTLHTSTFRWKQNNALSLSAGGGIAVLLARSVALVGDLHYTRAAGAAGFWVRQDSEQFSGGVTPPSTGFAPSNLRAAFGLQYTVWRKKDKGDIDGWREK